MIITIAIIGWMGYRMHKKAVRNAMRHEYYNAMLRGEQFTDAQHKQINIWINS